MGKIICVIVNNAQNMRMLSDFCQDVPYVDMAGRLQAKFK
jgi:hypothetical protein